MIRLKNITICFLFFFTLLSGNGFAQELLQNDKFTYAPLFDNQVVLIREIPFNNSVSLDKNFRIIKEWDKEHYASDPLISDITYDNPEKDIAIKSKIELILPPNEDNIREAVVMTYFLNTFICNNKCIFEAKGITYKLKNVKKKLKAEDTITEAAIAEQGPQQELRINIQKSTFYFFDELAASLEKALEAGI